MLEHIERYYDAVPRPATRVEEHGPLRLFVPDGAPWPYYARPTGEARVEDIAAVRARQRELGLAEAFEWIDELHPGLLGAARAAGLQVLEAPLMVLDRTQWTAAAAPDGIELRLLAPDDPAVAAARAVADIGFAAPGTETGPAGATERDAAAAAADPDGLAFVRERMRRRLTVTVVAERDGAPVGVGSHQPMDGVTEIVGVATLPSERRRGIGAAVTGALVEDAGADLVFLSAGSDAIARVYARLGFTRIGTACIAEA